LFAFLVDDDDTLAGIRDFGGRDQPGQAGADHDYICIISHRFFPVPFLIQARVPARGQRQMGSCL
jgi:hypothetical protein